MKSSSNLDRWNKKLLRENKIKQIECQKTANLRVKVALLKLKVQDIYQVLGVHYVLTQFNAARRTGWPEILQIAKLLMAWKTNPPHHSRCTPKCERLAASSRQHGPHGYQHSQQVDAHAHGPSLSAQVPMSQSGSQASHLPFQHSVVTS